MENQKIQEVQEILRNLYDYAVEKIANYYNTWGEDRRELFEKYTNGRVLLKTKNGYSLDYNLDHNSISLTDFNHENRDYNDWVWKKNDVVGGWMKVDGKTKFLDLDIPENWIYDVDTERIHEYVQKYKDEISKLELDVDRIVLCANNIYGTKIIDNTLPYFLTSSYLNFL